MRFLVMNLAIGRLHSASKRMLSGLALSIAVANFGATLGYGQASDPAYSVEWAWSQQDVASAGSSFWPQYRGPRGDGHALADATPPIHWSEEKNLTWKQELTGKAWSSPVVWGDRLWLTNATDNGLSMSVHCFELATGKALWERVLFKNQEVQKDFHVFNSYASPTPVVDGKHLFVSFGAYGTACLDKETGGTIWERRDLPCNHYRGAGSSPILFENSLIFHMDGFDVQYIVALDRSNGTTLWKTDRDIDYGTDNGDYKKAYGTPHVIPVKNGDRTDLQLISPAAKAVIAYDPHSGKELWKVRYEEHSASLRPLYDGSVIYTSTGFSKGKLLAIRPIGTGDLTEKGVLWQASKSIGAKPSPLLIGNQVIALEDRGVLSAINKETGETVWQKRLGGDFSSSPIFAGGKIYCMDEQGKGHVVSPEGEVLAENILSAGCLASPAAVGGTLLIRTRNAIYAFRE
ncbi:outer membrane biogenesis protein BamB [Pirellula sp. SH-Sr6A]|uniref:outer membrane protein assembly factor BamB family protein n=1 Tax=Pirellula sp. SH-Sr6A TaxID=1632865 RepID=UPI00078D4DF6|nr:PQQ-binding-like beta-propeller repeat protein [Pirellula sp. SH-Sr6A]AMV30533.1 outer membrane biogenesis protein BamB [Pirellula sp. SH-Sr6A]